MFFARKNPQDQLWLVFVAWIHGTTRGWIITLKPCWSEFRRGMRVLTPVTTEYSETTLSPALHRLHTVLAIRPCWHIFKPPPTDFSISGLWRSWDTNHFLFAIGLDRQGHTGSLEGSLCLLRAHKSSESLTYSYSWTDNLPLDFSPKDWGLGLVFPTTLAC